MKALKGIKWEVVCERAPWSVGRIKLYSCIVVCVLIICVKFMVTHQIYNILVWKLECSHVLVA